MNFADASEYLLSLGNEVSAMKLGLENIRKLLGELGDPQNKYKKVQVAGTNGKGSVCAFLDSICLQAGIKTGLYTSPHLVSITERIRINGEDISDKSFAHLATLVRKAAEKLVAEGSLGTAPTYFEQVTAIALVAFAEAKVELAILETGLGGRYDATTAANAEIAAITRIDLDHQEYLGDTIEEIAAEKAAIITAETIDVVIGEQSRDVMKLLRKHCSDLGIEPINDEYEMWRVLPGGGDTVQLDLSMIYWPPIRLGLKGHHQIENAQTAIQITRALLYHSVFPNGEDGEFYVVEGLKKARHSGRVEYRGRYLFDGAHNPAGARALREYLDEFVSEPITLIFGAMKEKNVAEIAEILWPKAEKIILTQPSNSRAMDVDKLMECLPADVDRTKAYKTNSVVDAIAKARTELPADGVILVTGSLYLVGEVKKIIEQAAANPRSEI